MSYASQIVFLSSILLLTACSALPDQDSIEMRSDKTATNLHNVSTDVQNATLSLSKGNMENLAFFAPTYWLKAKEYYEKALIEQKNEGRTRQAKRAAAFSQEYIAAGLRSKKMVVDTLPAMLVHKDTLDSLNARETIPKQYAMAVEKMLELNRLIEHQDIDGAKHKQKALLIDLKEIEIQAVDAKYLSTAHKMVAEALQLNADKIAQQTLQSTRNQIKDAQQFIRQNPNELLRISELATACEFSARRLVSITKSIEQLLSANDVQTEAYVLLEEQRLHRIAQSLGMSDLRDHAFDDQSRLIMSQGEQNAEDVDSALNDPNKISVAQLEKWKKKTVLLQAEIRRLQKMLNQ